MIHAFLLLTGFIAGLLINWVADILPNRRSWHEIVSSGIQLCKERPRRYLAVIVAAIGFTLFVYDRTGFSVMGVVCVLELWFFLAIAVIDLEHRRVLNVMLLPALPVIVIANWWIGMPTLTTAMIGAAVGFGVFLLLALLWPGGMGMGDVKLAGVIGLATGLSGVWVAIQISILAGGVAGLFLLLTRRRRGVTMAYAPYLVLGAWVALFQNITVWRG